jgi:hypothetical protein
MFGSPGARAGGGPGRLAYAWWRLRGMPGVAGSRGTRRRAMRARYRAWRARLKADPSAPRHRPWHAPWRMIPGGRMSWRHRFRNWRAARVRGRWSRMWRRRLVVPRDRHGRPLSRRARLARWWRIRRGHSPGIFRLRRRVPLRQRVTGRLRRLRPRNWRWLARRRGRPPRPYANRWWARTAAGRWLAGRLDRRRMARYMRRRGETAAQPVPRPRPARTVDGTGIFGPGHTRAGGNGMGANTVEPVIAEVQRLGSWDPGDPEDLDDTIRNLSRISRATSHAFRQIASRLEDHVGIHQDIPDALHENGESISHVSDELEGRLGGGLMSSRGGRTGGRSSTVSPVIDTIEELGGWTPDDPDDLHDTIRQLGGVLRAVGNAYTRLAETIRKTAAHQTYPEELDSAAGSLMMAAADAESRLGGGVMRRPGG